MFFAQNVKYTIFVEVKRFNQHIIVSSFDKKTNKQTNKTLVVYTTDTGKRTPNLGWCKLKGKLVGTRFSASRGPGLAHVTPLMNADEGVYQLITFTMSWSMGVIVSVSRRSVKTRISCQSS